MTPAGRPTVAVIGAGIAGLAAAWELARASPGAGVPSPEVHVFERDLRPGGVLRSAPFGGRTLDLAADGFTSRRPEAVTLCEELGIGDELVPAAATGGSVLARGRLRPLPAGLVSGVPTRWWPLACSGVLGPLESLRVARDLVVPHPGTRQVTGDRSVGEIVADRLGRPVVERLVDPVMGGGHAGSVDSLSAAAVEPVLIAASHQPGSLMHRVGRTRRAREWTGTPAVRPSGSWSLAGGTTRLVDRLVERLRAGGVAVHTGTAVEALVRDGHPATGGRPQGGPRWRLVLAGPDEVGTGEGTFTADAVVCALPATATATLLALHAPVAAGLLTTVEYASVSTVTVSVPVSAMRRPLSGAGFVVPQATTIDGRPALITGCTYLTHKWPHLAVADAELLRISVGRAGDLRPAVLDDDELAAAAFAQCAGVLSLTGPPSLAMVTRWDRGCPQYQVGHLVRVAEVDKAVAAVGGLAVAGAATRGVDIPACIGSGREAGRRVLRSLTADGSQVR